MVQIYYIYTSILCELNCPAGQASASPVSVSVSAPSNTCEPLANDATVGAIVGGVRGGKICCDEYGCSVCGQQF